MVAVDVVGAVGEGPGALGPSDGLTIARVS